MSTPERINTAFFAHQSPSVIVLISSLIAIVFLAVLLRIFMIGLPFERDEGEYAYIAWRLSEGELPYRDWFDQKPPGIFWIYRLAFLIFREPIRSVHFMGMVFAASTAVILYFVSRYLIGNQGALFSATIFLVQSADPLIEGQAANTELFMLLPLTMSHLFFLTALKNEGRNPWLLMTATGLSCGVACLFKQVALFTWVFFLVAYPLLVRHGKRFSKTVSFFALSSFGFFLVWSVVVSYFAAFDAFGDLVFNVITHNLEYVSYLPLSLRMSNLTSTLLRLSETEGVIWLFSVVGLAALLVLRQRMLALYLSGWFVSAVAGVIVSGYFFPHYFQQILLPMSLLCSVGATSLLRSKPGKMLKRTGYIVLCIVLFALPARAYYPFFVQYSHEEMLRRIYPGNYFGEMPLLGARLSEITRRGEKVFVFGAEPELYFYSGRISASRYIFLFPLYGRYTEVRERQREALEEVITNEPAAIVYIPSNLFFLPGNEHYLTAGIQRLIEESYRLDSLLVADGKGGAHLVILDRGEPFSSAANGGVAGLIYSRKDRSP